MTLTEGATIESLRRWGQFLLWVSIILPFMGALAAGARYYVERYEKRLSAKITDAAIRQATEDATAARADAGSARQEQSQISEDLVRSKQQLTELRERAAPRHIAAEQRQAMMPILKRLRGRSIAVACRMMDGESCDYGSDLINVLREAGCIVPDMIKTSLNDFPGYVVVTNHGDDDASEMGTIADALRSGGQAVRVEAVAENSVGMWYPNVAHVIVGRKAP